MATLESAIPPHLAQERTVPARTPDGYNPPVAAYSARFDKDAKHLVVAVLGVQYDMSRLPSPTAELKRLIAFLDNAPQSCRPLNFDLASVTDNFGAYNETAIAYWRHKDDYQNWAHESGFEEWFQGLDPSSAQTGYFLEVFFPSVDRFETVFSHNDIPEGAAHMREGVSGPILEHVYWGSMRDRLPLSQTDELQGQAANIASKDDEGSPSSKNRRIRVVGRKNLAVIRSGQDWSRTSPHERKLYLETMHPVLIKGMEFLRDHGEEVGCFSCRFMDVLPDSHSPAVDKETQSTEKTFGMAFFDDLASLEGWSKAHKTHLDIFGRFMQYAQELQGDVSLRLFHEVLVLAPEQQRFEYVGCHGNTGMLAGV